MHGFKSFAKRTELVFGPNFNCVLGPNGSGKSNVLDAICFVLGRSSAKSLRAEKSTNLIYNGGKLKNPAKEAEVSIYFDNTEKLFPFELPEIKISRIVRQNGQSIYKINDKIRTRQQVLELLSLGKIDPEGYNIILQGDIVRFCEMSPLERRGLIEEIAGISIYEEKKNKAINELNHVEEKLREADIVLKEREARLKELKKDRDQALKYKDITDKLNKNKASLLDIQIKRNSSKREEYDKKINSMQEKLDKINAEIASLKNSIAEKKESIEKINKEIESKSEKEQIRVHKEVESLKIELATSISRKEAYENEILKIKERIQNLNLNISEINERAKKLEEDKKKLQKEISVHQNSILEIDKKIAEFKKKHNLDSLGDIEKESEQIDKEIEEKQKEVAALRQEQQEILRKKDRLEFQLQSIDEKISKVLSIEKEQKEQLEILKKKQQEFKKATLELSELLNKDSLLSSELHEAKSRIESAQKELAKLNARSISIQETVAGDMAAKKIVESGIGGVYGQVSELGEVDSKYSLALEIAAGNKIKGIVVEDDKVAVQCIKYLKENRFGVATLFPLNKIKPKQINPEVMELKKQKGVHGFAIELVKFEPMFKNVFSYVFGDSLVVDDIETARKLGIGKAKMVTIDGDLAEHSGAMQGGYRGKMTVGGFREKDLTENVKKYEKIVQDTQSVINALEGKRKENEKKIDCLRKLKATLEGEIIKMEKSLHLESGDIEVNKKLKQQITNEIKDVEKDMKTIQAKIDLANEHLTKIKIKKQTLKDKIGSLRNPVLIAELNAFEEKKKELSSLIIEKSSELKNVEVQKTTMLEPEKENIEKIIKQHLKEEGSFRAKLKELIEKIKADEKILMEKEKIESEFYGRFRNLFTQRQKIDEELKKLDKKIEEANSASRNIELRINELSLERARIVTELEALEREFEQFKGIELFTNKSEEELKKEIRDSELFIAKIGNLNMRAIEVYDVVEKEYKSLVEKKEGLKKEKEDVLVMINEIETRKKELFIKTFDVINENFKRIFSALSTKGESNLILENKEQPFEGGILIKVRITGNKFLDIRSLSGGEKTLTALAFIFSIQEHEPAHFYVLDEVDAALDKRNSEKFAKLVRKYSENAQYIIISHNDSIVAEADYLYGVAMTEDGTSKVVSLKFNELNSQISQPSSAQ